MTLVRIPYQKRGGYIASLMASLGVRGVPTNSQSDRFRRAPRRHQGWWERNNHQLPYLLHDAKRAWRERSKRADEKEQVLLNCTMDKIEAAFARMGVTP